MIGFKIQGAIFDVDDTLLDNKPDALGATLHEKARLTAAHTVGTRHALQPLIKLSAQENLNAFLYAPVHTLDAAVWQILLMTGIADSDVINVEHPLHKEIVQLKNEYYEELLNKEGEAVPGAIAFVKALAAHGLRDKLAIASTAIRRDIDIFLKKTGLGILFPDERIIAKESITHPKPHPELFNRAFTSLNVAENARRQVCAFEDDPRGIMSAKSAGLFTCAITTRFSRDSLISLDVPPDLVAESFQEFAEQLGILREFNNPNSLSEG